MYKILTAAFLIALSACQAKVSEDADGEKDLVPAEELNLSDEQMNMAGIVSGKLEQKILSETLGCNGNVEIPPWSLVFVNLPLEGYVKKINFCSGSRVRKGELLTVMEHPGYLDLQQEYCKFLLQPLARDLQNNLS